jgi:hypothetical protein
MAFHVDISSTFNQQVDSFQISVKRKIEEMRSQKEKLQASRSLTSQRLRHEEEYT